VDELQYARGGRQPQGDDKHYPDRIVLGFSHQPDSDHRCEQLQQYREYQKDLYSHLLIFCVKSKDKRI
jgi:hypothetical protein